MADEGIQFEDNRAKVEEAMAEKAIAFLYEAVAWELFTATVNRQKQ